MPTRMKNIAIHAFRGIRDLTFPLQGKNLLLVGENGTGKSSLVDAVEFFFTGSVLHLDGVQGVSLTRHGPHVDYSRDSCEIKVSFDPGDISLTRTFASEPAVPANLKEYFDAARYRKFILRRSQILAFIISEPADRFREIGNIIGIEHLDHTELEMKAARDEWEGKINSVKAQIGSAFDYLTSIMGETISSLPEVLPALNRRLESMGFSHLNDLEAIDVYDQSVFSEFRALSSLHEKSKGLNDANQVLNDCLLSTQFISEFNEFQECISSYLASNIDDYQQANENILVHGKEILESRSPNLCPLCLQPIKPDDVLDSIRSRLELARSLSQVASRLRIATSSLTQHLDTVRRKLDEVATKLNNLSNSSEQGKNTESASMLTVELSGKISLLAEKPITPPEKLKQYVERINSIVNEAINANNKTLSSLNIPPENRSALEAIQLLEKVKMKHSDLKKDLQIMHDDQLRFEIAEKIYTRFSETKKARIQQIYSSIESDVTRFYNVLHIGEGIGRIELSTVEARRASTLLKMEIFGREGEDPRGLASEGHLDSMGLCIFFAFVKKFNQDCPLVVLDDVVSSIDSQHRQNICRLLLEEFKDKQLIVTTHDEMWYKQLIQAEMVYGVRSDFENRRIVSWNRETGPTISEYKTDWQDIEEKIAAGDKSGAGNACRNYLEWVLERICKMTSAQTIFKGQDPRYDIGDLYPAAKKRLLELPKDEQVRRGFEGIFRTLDMTIMMGNLMSHSNELRDISSIGEVKAFSQAIEALRKAVSCSGCDQFLDYIQKSNELRCPNSHCNTRTTIVTR